VNPPSQTVTLVITWCSDVTAAMVAAPAGAAAAGSVPAVSSAAVVMGIAHSFAGHQVNGVRQLVRPVGFRSFPAQTKSGFPGWTEREAARFTWQISRLG
jgi:hypothetical protein